MSLRVFVVGPGSIGRRHLENLRALGVTAEGGRLDAAAAWRPDAIVVSSPTSEHLAALRWAVEHGAHAYVEKPIAASSAGVAETLALAEAAGLAVAVGYNLRFHPALEAVRAGIAEGRLGRLLSVRAEVGHHLPSWHPNRDYRRSYAAQRELGGGALLTLSHELDYVRWIAGEVVDCVGVVARVSALELDADDVVEAVLRHEGGTISSVHADFLDRTYNRRSRWIGEQATISWTWSEGVAVDGASIWEPDGFDLNETYVAALQDFLVAAAEGAPPRAGGRDGLRVLELCEALRR